MMDAKITQLQPLLSSTFYTVLDSLESEKTHCTTDDEFDNDVEWDINDIAKKEKGHKRFKFTKTVNPSSETESIPIIHYSRKNSDVPHPHTCTTTQKHPFAGQSGENLRGRHFEVWNSKLCNPEATEQTRLAAQNQIEHASSRHCKYDNSAQYYRKKSSNAMNAEALTGSSNQILVRVSSLPIVCDHPQFSTSLGFQCTSEVTYNSSGKTGNSRQKKSSEMVAARDSIRTIGCTRIPSETARSNMLHNIPPSTEITKRIDGEVISNDRLTSLRSGKRMSCNEKQPRNPPQFHDCIKYYEELCVELTREKDQLEENKWHVKQDLSKLKIEMKGNAHSVKSLEQKMERLQNKRRKRVSHGSASTRAFLPKNTSTLKAEEEPMTERSHKTLVKVFNNDTVTAHVRLSKEGNGLHDSLKCTSEHGTRESSIQPLHKHRSKDQSSDATDINGVKSLERVAEKLKSMEGRSVSSQTKAKLFREEVHRSNNTCPLRENFNKLFGAEMKLTQLNHNVKLLEECLITAKEKTKIAEENLFETEDRAEKAERDLNFFREETKKMKRELYVLVEEHKLEKTRLKKLAATTEEEVSIAQKTANELKSELIKETDRAVRAEKDHLNAIEKVKMVEAELFRFQDRAQKAKRSFEDQKNDLIERANHAEDRLLSVKNTVQVAEEKIQEFELRFVEVEDDICKVKGESEEKLKDLQQKLKSSEERAASVTKELHALHENSERELLKANNRASEAENNLMALKQDACHTETALRESLEWAKRESHEATIKLQDVEKVLANQKLEIMQQKERCILENTRVHKLPHYDTTNKPAAIFRRHSKPQDKDDSSDHCIEHTKSHLNETYHKETTSRINHEEDSVESLKSRLRELATENDELKSCLTEQKKCKRYHKSKEDRMRMVIAALDKKNSQLKNKLTQLGHEASKQERRKHKSTQKISKATIDDKAVPTCTERGDSCDNKQRMTMRAEQTTRSNEPPNIAVQLQCDEIQDKMTTFISTLKTAQKNILQSDVKRYVPAMKTKGSNGTGNPGSRAILLPQEQPRKSKKKMPSGLTSQEYMKLQNMKKWLMEGSNAAVQPNNIINHCEAEVSNVTSEISSKIKRLSRHFQLQQNVEVNTIYQYLQN